MTEKLNFWRPPSNTVFFLAAPILSKSPIPHSQKLVIALSSILVEKRESCRYSRIVQKQLNTFIMRGPGRLPNNLLLRNLNHNHSLLGCAVCVLLTNDNPRYCRNVYTERRAVCIVIKPEARLLITLFITTFTGILPFSCKLGGKRKGQHVDIEMPEHFTVTF